MNFSKYYYMLTLIISFNAFSMQLNKQSISTSDMEEVYVENNNKGLAISNGKMLYLVKKYWIDPQIRDMSTEELTSFLKENYIILKQMSDGEYKAQAHVRGNGGGPILANLFYWGTKTLCYGTAVAGAGAAVAATGGAAGAVMGATVAASTVGATAGASIVGGTIAGAGLAVEAGTATVAVVTSAGGLAGAVTAVETVSLAAGALGMAIPWL